MFETFTAEELRALELELMGELTTVTQAVIATSQDVDAQTPLFEYSEELSHLHSEVCDAWDLRVVLDVFAAGGIPSWQPRTVTLGNGLAAVVSAKCASNGYCPPGGCGCESQ